MNIFGKVKAPNRSLFVLLCYYMNCEEMFDSRINYKCKFKVMSLNANKSVDKVFTLSVRMLEIGV